jgi:hypothetical protein
MKRGRPRKPGNREPNGRIVRNARSEREKLMRVQIEARCRAVGIWPPELERIPGESAAAFEGRQLARDGMIRSCAVTVSLPWFGDNIGRRIAGEQDVAELWQTIQHIRRRREAYLAAIAAPSDHAKCASAFMVSGNGDEGNEVMTIDIRDESERHDGAIRAWEHVEEILGKALPMVMQAVIHDLPGWGIVTVLRRLREEMA